MGLIIKAYSLEQVVHTLDAILTQVCDGNQLIWTSGTVNYFSASSLFEKDSYRCAKFNFYYEQLTNSKREAELDSIKEPVGAIMHKQHKGLIFCSDFKAYIQDPQTISNLFEKIQPPHITPVLLRAYGLPPNAIKKKFEVEFVHDNDQRALQSLKLLLPQLAHISRL